MRRAVSSLIQKTTSFGSPDALQNTLKELPSISVSEELTILTTDAGSKNVKLCKWQAKQGKSKSTCKHIIID